MYQNRVNEYVFDNPQKFYNTSCKWFPRLVKKAGLDHCTLHDLGRTASTLMKDSGIPEEVVTQLIGNTREVNRTHYTGTLKKRQRVAVNSLPSVG